MASNGKGPRKRPAKASSPGTLSEADRANLERLTLERRGNPRPEDKPPASPLGEVALRVVGGLRQLSPEEQAARDAKRQAAKLAEERREIVANLGRLKMDCGERLCPFQRATFERYRIYDERQGEVVAKLRAFVANLGQHVPNGDPLFLIGNPGTGKDHLAVAVAREIVARFRTSARWLDCSVLRATVRDGMKTDGRELALISPFVNAGVLILSDLCPPGAKLTDFQAETLFRIVDSRYRAMKPTFATANLHGDADAAEAIGTQVVDRLSHGGLRLKFTWESFRRKGRE